MKENYGIHRVIAPYGSVPQAARLLNNAPRLLNQKEVLIDVHTLQLDSTSMRDLRTYRGYDDGVRDEILKIVEKSGKMQNPRTGSGGVFVGKVREIGSERADFPHRVGDEVISLVSLTAVPLHLESVGEIHGDQVAVRGTAVFFPCYHLAKVPDDFSASVALAALDISSLVPQVERIMDFPDGSYCFQKFFIIGCGKAGVTAAALLRDRGGCPTTIAAVDFSENQLATMKELGYVGDVFNRNLLGQLDATDAGKMLEFAHGVVGEFGFDVVINCVNVPGTEAASVIAARPGGTVIFFSMATNFQRAVLSTDAIGKDVRLLMGAGIAKDQDRAMLDLLRKDKKLRSYFEALCKR